MGQSPDYSVRRRSWNLAFTFLPKRVRESETDSICVLPARLTRAERDPRESIHPVTTALNPGTQEALCRAACPPLYYYPSPPHSSGARRGFLGHAGMAEP